MNMGLCKLAVGGGMSCQWMLHLHKSYIHTVVTVLGVNEKMLVLTADSQCTHSALLVCLLTVSPTVILTALQCRYNMLGQDTARNRSANDTEKPNRTLGRTGRRRSLSETHAALVGGSKEPGRARWV